MIIFTIIFLTGCAAESYYRHLKTVPELVTTLFVWPLRGPIVSRYGEVERGVALKGILLQGSEGDKVRAVRDGKVILVDHKMRGYGATVILQHDEYFSTVYARNSEILVDVGQSVHQGQPIARVGGSGKGKAPLLYFELRKKGASQDPAKFLPTELSPNNGYDGRDDYGTRQGARTLA